MGNKGFSGYILGRNLKPFQKSEAVIPPTTPTRSKDATQQSQTPRRQPSPPDEREPSARREESQKEEKPKVERTVIFTLDDNPQTTQQQSRETHDTLKSTIDSYERTPITERMLVPSSPQPTALRGLQPLDPTQTSSIQGSEIKSDYQLSNLQIQERSQQQQKIRNQTKKQSYNNNNTPGDGKLSTKSINKKK